MTVISQVKQSLASMKSMNATFQQFALTSSDDEAKKTFHEIMITSEEVISDLKNRINEMEMQEPQYKGF